MTVSVDVTTEDVRTLTTSPQTFSHAGAASGVKGVLLAIVHGTSSTDHVTAASYGGVAMTRKQRNTDTATEPGAAELWFLGAGVPQGTQTVSYTPGATDDDIHAVCITLLGAADLYAVDVDGISENVANPSVTLQYGGISAMAFAALYGGGAAPTSFTPNANCTAVHDHDLGAFYSSVIRQTTAGSADFAIGGTSTTDDVAFAAIAVAEVQAATIVLQTIAGLSALNNLEVAAPAPVTLQAVTAVASLPNVNVATPALMTLQAVAGVAALPNVSVTALFSPLILQAVAGVGNLANVTVAAPNISKVELGSSSDHATATLVTQTIETWDASQLSITFTVVKGGLSLGAVWVFVTDREGLVSPGFAVTLEAAGTGGLTLQAVAGVASLANVTITAPFTPIVLQSVAGIGNLPNVEVTTPSAEAVTPVDSGGHFTDSTRMTRSVHRLQTPDGLRLPQDGVHRLQSGEGTRMPRSPVRRL